MKDAKHIFNCAAQKGEAKIAERILVRVLPELIKYDKKLTLEIIEASDTLMVPDELYGYICEVAQELTGFNCFTGNKLSDS